METEIILEASIRNKLGGNTAERLRKEGLVPGIIYGEKRTPIAISVSQKDITKIYQQGKYTSKVITMTLGEENIKAMIKHVTLHPVKSNIIHLDFLYLNESPEGYQKIDMPIEFLNRDKCIGIKKGGFFNTVARKIQLSCPVDNIVSCITLNLADKEIGTVIKASDITLPPMYVCINKNKIVASIIGRKSKTAATTENTTQPSPAKNTPAKASPAKSAPAKASPAKSGK